MAVSTLRHCRRRLASTLSVTRIQITYDSATRRGNSPNSVCRGFQVLLYLSIYCIKYNGLSFHAPEFVCTRSLCDLVSNSVGVYVDRFNIAYIFLILFPDLQLFD